MWPGGVSVIDVSHIHPSIHPSHPPPPKKKTKKKNPLPSHMRCPDEMYDYINEISLGIRG